MVFSSLILFVIAGMSDVPIIDIAELSLLLAIQVAGGAALWYAVNDYHQIEIPEAVGMGLALGTSITTLSHVLLRETFFSNYTWAIPLIFLIPLIKHSQSKTYFEHQADALKNKSDAQFSVTAIFALVVLAMATTWWWLYPMSIAIFLICIIVYRRLKQASTLGSAGIASIAILIFGFLSSLILRGQNEFWKVMSFDQVFSESLSWSLFRWGSNDSPFVSGTPINYHWFVLLWSGIMSEATNAESWVVVTRVLPVISFLGIFCLIWTLAKGIYKEIHAPIIAILFLIFYSNNFGFSITRYVVSPTFLFSCIWLLAFTKSVFSFYANHSYKLAILSACLLFMTFGGKVMNGAVGISGLLFALSIWLLAKNLKPPRFKISLLAILSLSSLALIYVYMYSKNQPGNLNTLFIRSLLPVQLGLLPPDRGGIYLVILNTFLVVAMMLPLIATAIYSAKQELRTRFEVWFIMGSILSGLILTFMTTHPGSSQLYFWLASMILAALLIPTVVNDGLLLKTKLNSLIPIGLIALVAAFACIKVWNKSIYAGSGYESIKYKFLAILCGILIIIFSISMLYLFSKKETMLRFRYVHYCLLSVFLLFNLAIGFNQQISNFVTRSQIESSDPSDPNLITGSNDQLEALDWIRLNTDESDVLATNRFCIPGLSFCISKWQLVSAVSHRRLLFEGGYYELPSIPDQELAKRYLLSTEFGLNPSPIALRRLCDYGVQWYFFDHSVADPLDSWEPYAATQIQNEGVSLLKLRCPTK
jgi:hypothetical protein